MNFDLPKFHISCQEYLLLINFELYELNTQIHVHMYVDMVHTYIHAQ